MPDIVFINPSAFNAPLSTSSLCHERRFGFTAEGDVGSDSEGGVVWESLLPDVEACGGMEEGTRGGSVAFDPAPNGGGTGASC